MKSSRIKYALIVFVIGIIMSHHAKAQQLSGLFSTKQSDIRSLWAVIPPSSSMFNDHIFLSDSIGCARPINGPITPKSAIFCQFENRLWKSFDIGIRLRVETPMPSH
jgi:hypothetical protein